VNNIIGTLNSTYSLYGLMWDIAASCAYSLTAMALLYVTFKGVVFFITSIVEMCNFGKEIKSITLPFKGYTETSTSNIKALTKQLNAVKDANNISVKDVLHITTIVTDDNKMECTIWYYVRKKSNVYKYKSPYDGLDIFSGDK
jgi:hypothetical protein